MQREAPGALRALRRRHLVVVPVELDRRRDVVPAEAVGAAGVQAALVGQVKTHLAEKNT